MTTGHLFIISGPSGSGKTTIRKAILKRYPQLRYSVSCTTRPKRKDETEGVDYFFIEPSEFRQRISSGQWAEWAEVHGNFYGTSDMFLRDALENRTDVLLDIDVQGARQILRRYPESVTIFILPPDLETLKKRLESRASDSRETIFRRLRDAERELAHQESYRYRVVNDSLEDAIDRVAGIIESVKKGCPG
jgi:guanylate kinase